MKYLLLMPLLVLSCTLTNTAMQALPTVTPTKYELIPEIVKADELCTVTADWLNVRSGPSKHYPAISWLRKGETVTILDQSDKWLRTSVGWIHGSYCDDLSSVQ